MNIKCAKCGKNMGKKPPLDDHDTTHGICQECYEKEIHTIREANDV